MTIVIIGLGMILKTPESIRMIDGDLKLFNIIKETIVSPRLDT